MRDDYDIKIPKYGSGDNLLPLPGQEIIEEVEGGVPDISDLGTIVGIILNNRSIIKELAIATRKLADLFFKLNNTLEDQYTLYIDNVDQAFLEELLPKKDDPTLPFETMRHDPKERAKVKTWLNANIALFLVVWNINKKVDFVSVFASLRLEAWNHFIASELGRNMANLRGNVILIDYTNKQLRGLIDKYLELQVDPVAGIMKKLMNTTRKHPKTEVENQNKETFKDMIIRHTFGNPRDLVFLLPLVGQKLLDLIEDKVEIDTDEMGLFIDQMAHEVVFKEYFVPDCLPAFPKTEVDRFLKKIKKNFFELSNLPAEEIELVTELYRFGLIGTVKRSSSDGYVQHFRRGSNYAEERVPLAPSEIYLLHPCLDYPLGEIYINFYYPLCVIGHGKPFVFKHDMDYYLPPQSFLPASRDVNDNIKQVYQVYYNEAYSIAAFSKMSDSIISKYTYIILDKTTKTNTYPFLEHLKSDFFKEPNFCLLKCSQKVRALGQHNGRLVENIRLRVLLVLGVLFEVVEHGGDVLDLFGDLVNETDRTLVFHHYLFCQGVYRPTGKIDKERAFNSLSRFEQGLVNRFISSTTMITYLNGLESLNRVQNLKETITYIQANFISHNPA